MATPFWIRSLIPHDASRKQPRKPTRKFQTNPTARRLAVTELEDRSTPAVALLGTAVSQYMNSDTLPAFSVGAGTDRLLVVTASDTAATDVTNVTFNGTPLIEAVTRNDTVAVDEIWYLPLGSSGTPSGNIVITTNGTGSRERYISAAVFTGVNQTTPVTGPQSTKASASNSMLTVASDPGDLVYDIFDTYRSGAQATLTPGGGQTTIATAGGAITTVPPTNFFGKYANSTKPGASPSISMSWMSDASALIQAAINIEQAAPTGTVSASVAAGVLTVTDLAGNNNAFALSSDGNNVTISDPGNTFTTGGNSFSTPLAGLTAINVSGAGGNDTLSVTLGNALPNVSFAGGAGGTDSLALVGGTAATQTFNFTNENDGSVVHTGGTAAGTVTYTGLEPVTSTVTAANVVLNYGASTETITVTAAGAQTQVDSNVGGEVVTFNNPTDRLEINAGDGTDTVVVTSFGTGFNAALDIDGEAGTGDTVNLNAAVTYASGNSLTLAAETINIAAAQTLTGTGAVSAVAGRNITVTGAVSTAGGNILLDADTGSQVAGGFVGVDVAANVTGTGTVTVEGRGGDSGSFNIGVQVRSGAQISGGAGPGVSTSVTGVGGGGAGSTNYGVFVRDSNTKITSTGGDVELMGTAGGGGGSGLANIGVYISSSSQVTSGGSGSVTVDGTGGSGMGNVNHGVFVLSAARITSGGGGTVTVMGSGGGSPGLVNYGVYVSDPGSQITSGGGDVSVTGIGGGSGASTVNQGVFVESGGSLISPAALSVTGTKGANTLEGILVMGGTISSTGLTTLTGLSGSDIFIDPAVTANFGSLTVSTTATATITEDSATVLAGTSSVGTLNLTSAGSVTQTGPLSVTTAVLNAGANDITLTNTGNAIGSVDVTGNGVSLTDNSGFVIDAASVGTLLTLSSASLILQGAGAITGAGGLTQAGTGTTNLSQTNTYTGPTTVAAGRLNVIGSIDSNVTVTGGTLGGIGTVNTAKTVAVNGGGTVAPGTSPGVLNTGSVAFASGSTFSVEVNGNVPGTGHDQLNVTGTVTLAMTTLAATGTITSVPNQVIVLIANDGTDAVIGTFAGRPEGSTVTINGVPFVLSYQGGSGNDVTLTQPGNFTFTVPTNGAADNYTLRLAGTLVQLLDGGGTILDSRPFSTVTSYTVQGENGQNDQLTVDFGGGNPIPSGGVTFHGGTGGNDALVLGAGSTTTVTHKPTTDNDGSVDLAGAIAGTISYTGLEPILDNLSATNRVFDFLSGTSETITLTDSGGANGMMTIDSSAAEAITFTNPTAQLTVITTNGSGSDTVNLNGYDAAFAGSVTVTGGTGETVNANAAFTFAANQSLSLNGQTISIAAAQTTSGTGGITLVAVAGGTATQTAALSTPTLVLGGSGNAGTYTLTNAGNTLGTLAATTTGNVTVTDSAGGLVLAGGNVGGTYALTTVGGLTQSAAVTAGSLSVSNSGSGGIILASSSNPVGTFAASNSATGGAVTMKFAAGGTVGTVGGVVGISTAGGTVAVSTNAAGVVSVNSPITTVGGGVNVSASPAGSSLSLGASIDTTGGANAGAVVLTSANAATLTNTVTINTDNAAGTDGLAQLPNSLNAQAGQSYSLTVTAGGGNVTAGNIGATTALAGLSLTGNAVSVGSIGTGSGGIALNGTAVLLNGPTVQSDRTPGAGTAGATAGAVNITGPMTLGTAVTIDSDATTTDANILISGTVNGAQALALTSGAGTIEVTGAIGGTAALTSLTITTGTGTTTLGGGLVRTAGAQAYNTPVVVGTNTTFQTTANGVVRFFNSLNGSTAAGQSVAVSTGSGQVRFGPVGTTTALGSLTVTTSGLVSLIGSITTDVGAHTGAIDFGAATGGVLLFISATLNANANGDAAGGPVSFTSAVNANTATGQALTVTSASGAVTLGAVGTTTELGGLTVVTTTGLTTLNGNITTDDAVLNGNIDFGGAAGGVRLGNTITIDANASNGTAGGLINLNTAVNATTAGAQGLTVVTSDGDGTNSVILGTVGGTTPVGFLTVGRDSTPFSAVRLNGSITTDVGPLSGNVDFGGANGGVVVVNSLTVNADANGDATGGNIVLTGSPVNGATAGGQALTLKTGSAAGNVSTAAVGTGTALLSLTVDPAVDITINGAVVVTQTVSTKSATLTAGAIATGTGLTVELTGAGSITGVISGPGTATLVKNGTGTLTLTGTSTYDGATTVNTGVLLVNGNNSAANGAITVVAGAVLGGNGLLGGSLTGAGTVAPGATFSPPSTAVLSGALGGAISGVGTYSFNLNGTVAGTSYDRLSAASTVNVSGSTLNLLVGYTPTVYDRFDVITNSIAVAGEFTTITGFGGAPVTAVPGYGTPGQNGSVFDVPVMGGGTVRMILLYNFGGGNNVVLFRYDLVQLTSIVRTTLNPTDPSVQFLTNRNQVTYRVTFNQPIQGLSGSNFTPEMAAGPWGSTIMALSMGSAVAVDGSDVPLTPGTPSRFWTVTLNTGMGNGQAWMELTDPGAPPFLSGVTDQVGIPVVYDDAQDEVVGVYEAERYDVDKVAPRVAAFQLIYGTGGATDSTIGNRRFVDINSSRSQATGLSGTTPFQSTLPWQIVGARAVFTENVTGQGTANPAGLGVTLSGSPAGVLPAGFTVGTPTGYNLPLTVSTTSVLTMPQLSNAATYNGAVVRPGTNYLYQAAGADAGVASGVQFADGPFEALVWNWAGTPISIAQALFNIGTLRDPAGNLVVASDASAPVAGPNSNGLGALTVGGKVFQPVPGAGPGVAPYTVNTSYLVPIVFGDVTGDRRVTSIDISYINNVVALGGGQVTSPALNATAGQYDVYRVTGQAVGTRTDEDQRYFDVDGSGGGLGAITVMDRSLVTSRSGTGIAGFLAGPPTVPPAN